MHDVVLPVSPLYRGAILQSLRQQVAWGLLCLLLLDGGRGAKVCAATMLGFWAGVAIMMTRRPLAPGRGDLAVLRWGFPPLLVGALTLATLA